MRRSACGPGHRIARLLVLFSALLVLALVTSAAALASERTADHVDDSGAQTATAETPDTAPQATTKVALATIAPGDIYWQRFGHNMVLITPADGSDTVSYNFGYFDFEQPGFLRRFLLGRMLYQALAIPARHDLAAYVDEDRTIAVQTLAMTPTQADALAQQLADAVQPENRDYLYEYFRANCSTRVRDALDAALNGELRRQTATRSRGFTYRMHAARLAQDDFWLALGIDLGLGPDTDHRLSFWEEMFIPEMLRRYIGEVVTADGQPLVTGQRLVHEGQGAEPAELPPDRRLPMAIAGVFVALVILWLSTRARTQRGARRALVATAAGLHLLFGLAGAMLLFLWLGTDHIAAHRNENLFLLNPLSLAVAALWVRGPKATTVGNVLAWLVGFAAACALVVKVLPDVFIQQNLHWSLLFLPIHAALLVAWRRSTVTR